MCALWLAALAAAEMKIIFSPYDGLENTEADLHTLKTVVEARAAYAKKHPGKTFEKADNPFRIQWAVYNIIDEAYITPLIAAAKQNLFVQLLVDHNSLSQYRPEGMSHTFQKFKDAGLLVGHDVNVTNKDMTEDQRNTYTLIPMYSDDGLFHFKIRYFTWLDEKEQLQHVLMSGSMNPEFAGTHYNYETFRIHTPPDPLMPEYMKMYDATLHMKPYQNQYSEADDMNLLFSRGEGVVPRQVLFELVEKEQELILLSVFDIQDLKDPRDPNRTLVDELCKAVDRGVKVGVVVTKDVTDGSEPSGPLPVEPTHAVSRLNAQCGVPVYKAKLPTFVSGVHTKDAVFGLTKPTILTDSENWSYGGMGFIEPKATTKDSMVVLRHSHDLLLRFLSNHIAMLRRFSEQQHCPCVFNKTVSREWCAENQPTKVDWDMPSHEVLVNNLAAIPTWPLVQLAGVSVFSSSKGPAKAELVCRLPSYPNRHDDLRVELTAAGRGKAPNSYYEYVGSTEATLPFGVKLDCSLLAGKEIPLQARFKGADVIVDTTWDWADMHRFDTVQKTLDLKLISSPKEEWDSPDVLVV